MNSLVRDSRGIHLTTQMNKWKEVVQVMWTCLLFSLIILMNFRLSSRNKDPESDRDYHYGRNESWRTLERKGNQGKKLLLSMKGNFLTNTRGNVLRTYVKLVN